MLVVAVGKSLIFLQLGVEYYRVVISIVAKKGMTRPPSDGMLPVAPWISLKRASPASRRCVKNVGLGDEEQGRGLELCKLLFVSVLSHEAM